MKKMISKRLVTVLVGAALVLGAGAAFATPASDQQFVEAQHTKLTTLLKQPPSVSRDTQVNQQLDTMVDYEEMTRRAFGKPCPATVPGCKNWWDTFSKEDQDKLVSKLRKLVEKNYRKNLTKTLHYNITYRGAHNGTNAGETRVITEAQDSGKLREPPVRVDYVILPNNGKPFVVDIYTENSSLTKNYYFDFNRMLLNPAQGLQHVMDRLDQKAAAP